MASGKSPTKHAMHRPPWEGRLPGCRLLPQELQGMEGSPNSPPLQIHSWNWWLDGDAHWDFPGETEANVH